MFCSPAQLCLPRINFVSRQPAKEHPDFESKPGFSGPEGESYDAHEGRREFIPQRCVLIKKAHFATFYRPPEQVPPLAEAAELDHSAPSDPRRRKMARLMVIYKT